MTVERDRCISIRRARPADEAAVSDMLSRSSLPLAGVSDWFDYFWVAEHGDAVVGVAGLELYGTSALLRSVAVDPTWRGSGVGRALVDQVLHAAQEAGTRDVYLLTTTAEHYFPRFGFACISRNEVPDALHASVEFRSACPESAVVMRKEVESRKSKVEN